MSKLAQAFANKHKSKAFIAYVMAGDPNLPASAEIILAAQEAGADLVEIGIPFSDPIAEGEVIQAASVRALAAGTRLDGVFDMVASIRSRMRVPMAFMTYVNPVFVYGYDRFFARCAAIGVGGVIIPDMPFEEQGELKPFARRHGVEIVTLIAPTSASRTATIARDAEGFVYVVSSMGVTGVRSEITTDLPAIVADIRNVTDVPVAIGFGISTPDQAATFATIADGVIVGSALVRIIGQHGENATQPLIEFIRSMKEKMKRATPQP